MTEPGLIEFTISEEISLGAGLPGIIAVVMMISASATQRFIDSASAFLYASDISFAYPPSPEPSSLIGTS
jgi:hypothetical protein